MDRCSDPPVGVGILGAGRPNIATSSHIPGCQRSQKARIVALCDRLDSVRDCAAKCGAKAYTDYAAMLADPDVDVVHVATPDWCHCSQTEQALTAGKHVLLQKPPCVTMSAMGGRGTRCHKPGAQDRQGAGTRGFPWGRGQGEGCSPAGPAVRCYSLPATQFGGTGRVVRNGAIAEAMAGGRTRLTVLCAKNCGGGFGR